MESTTPVHSMFAVVENVCVCHGASVSAQHACLGRHRFCYQSSTHPIHCSRNFILHRHLALFTPIQVCTFHSWYIPQFVHSTTSVPQRSAHSTQLQLPSGRLHHRPPLKQSFLLGPCPAVCHAYHDCRNSELRSACTSYTTWVMQQISDIDAYAASLHQNLQRVAWCPTSCMVLDGSVDT